MIRLSLIGQLRAAALDALAVASYGKIIPASLLKLTPWPLNVHPSPLPLLRGPSPLRTALLQGSPRTEVCIMSMTPRIDDGPVMLRAELAIQAEMNLADAYDYTSQVMTENMMARDAEVGIGAFIEKRDPKWEDR